MREKEREQEMRGEAVSETKEKRECKQRKEKQEGKAIRAKMSDELEGKKESSEGKELVEWPSVEKGEEKSGEEKEDEVRSIVCNANPSNNSFSSLLDFVMQVEQLSVTSSLSSLALHETLSYPLEEQGWNRDAQILASLGQVGRERKPFTPALHKANKNIFSFFLSEFSLSRDLLLDYLFACSGKIEVCNTYLDVVLDLYECKCVNELYEHRPEIVLTVDECLGLVGNFTSTYQLKRTMLVVDDEKLIKHEHDEMWCGKSKLTLCINNCLDILDVLMVKHELNEPEHVDMFGDYLCKLEVEPLRANIFTYLHNLDFKFENYCIHAYFSLTGCKLCEYLRRCEKNYFCNVLKFMTNTSNNVKPPLNMIDISEILSHLRNLGNESLSCAIIFHDSFLDFDKRLAEYDECSLELKFVKIIIFNKLSRSRGSLQSNFLNNHVVNSYPPFYDIGIIHSRTNDREEGRNDAPRLLSQRRGNKDPRCKDGTSI